MRIYLKQGMEVKHEGRVYAINDKLGAGASCVAYSAVDKSTGSNCVIKEYYPYILPLERGGDGELVCPQKYRHKFEEGIARFYAACEQQIALRNYSDATNQINYIYDIFYANQTVYSVVPRERGKVYRDNAGISLYDRMRICRGVACYVQKCHEAGYLCLDIKPENIFVLPETPELPMFFDFDSMCKQEEIVSGKSTSYTESWAAPEQIIPGGFRQISTATDIYILGELVFWSVFDRHSEAGEHRMFSEYPFDTTKYTEEIDVQVAQLLEELFHNTIRSVVKNRYTQVKSLVDKLDEVIVELHPKKEKLITVFPPKNLGVFYGREAELEKIQELLNTYHIAVVVGIGGIGKSELVNRYIFEKSNAYRKVVYITYSSSLCEAINRVEFISGCERKKEETEKEYCFRKLSKLAELCDRKTLLVIDNFNIEIERLEEEEKEVWDKIRSLQCSLLLTTRCAQESLTSQTVKVDALEKKWLIKLYSDYAKSASSEEVHIEKIIDLVQHHTLVVELVAKQAYNRGLSPELMYQELSEHGVLKLSNDSVKWNGEEKTIEEFVRKLFSLAGLSEEQKALLLKLSFMPVAGVSEKAFFMFYKLENHNDIRYLVDNGWLEEKNGDERILMVHPVIATVVIEEAITSQDQIEKFYSDTLECIDQWEQKNESEQKGYLAICNSVAEQSCQYDVIHRKAAEYLIKYNDVFCIYETASMKKKGLLHAIKIYEKLYSHVKYCAIKEYAHTMYMQYAALSPEKIKECEEHAKAAEKNKDYYMLMRWYAELVYCDASWKDFSGYYEKMAKMVLVIRKKVKNNFFTQQFLSELHYDFLVEELDVWLGTSFIYCNCTEYQDVEDKFLIGNLFELSKIQLRRAIKIRKRLEEWASSYRNKQMILKDEARINLIERKYEEAEAMYEKALQLSEENGESETIISYQLHVDLGHTAYMQKKYEKAIMEYRRCLDLGEILGIKDSRRIRCRLSMAYLHIGELERAEALQKELEKELSNEEELSSIFLEVYLCVAYRYIVLKEVALAKEYVEKALALCSTKVKFEELFGYKVILAHCNMRLGEIYGLMGDQEKAKQFLEAALKEFKLNLGNDHPETIDCEEKWKNVSEHVE